MAVLASLCGTPWLPKIKGGAILLEDVDETPYRLDRFVTQLHDSDFFSDVEGVFLGQFTKCGTDNAGLKVVTQRLSDLGISFLGELPVGHEALHLPLFFDLSYKFEARTGTLQPQGNRVDA
jgi:muramoyltetrapeptide carboxypeptidase